MNDCPFYKTQETFFARLERHPLKKPSGEYKTSRWCEHKHSPVDKRDATRGFGAELHLLCMGDRQRCPISKDLAADAAAEKQGDG